MLFFFFSSKKTLSITAPRLVFHPSIRSIINYLVNHQSRSNVPREVKQSDIRFRKCSYAETKFFFLRSVAILISRARMRNIFQAVDLSRYNKTKLINSQTSIDRELRSKEDSSQLMHNMIFENSKFVPKIISLIRKFTVRIKKKIHFDICLIDKAKLQLIIQSFELFTRAVYNPSSVHYWRN